MHFRNALLAILAAGNAVVLAAPGPAPEAVPEAFSGESGDSAGLFERTHPQCKPTQAWCGWNGGSCKCDDGDVYDKHTRSCHAPAHPDPGCNKKEKAHCARSVHEWCPYDPKNPLCWDDGSTVVFCVKNKRIKHEVEKQCPPKHPFCGAPRHWSWERKRCECPRGKVYRSRQNTCAWKPLDEPWCPKRQTAYCASGPKKVVAYDKWHSVCSNNGKNVVFCAKKNEEGKWCKSNWVN